ncbi:MAG: hypothetical protein MI743_19040 [Sneathiellales bacterium]|nr:hypothetical protein [Sneathiellales bacterium]
MSELLNGFYAFSYYINAYVLQFITAPFEHVYFELAAPYVALLSILSINRIISGKTLVFLTILFGLAPVGAKALFLGSLTQSDVTWLNSQDFMLIGSFLSAGSLLLLLFLAFEIFSRKTILHGEGKWLGYSVLAIAFFFVLGSSSTMWAFLFLSPNVQYKPEIAFQWYGQFIAILISPILVILIIPAALGVLPRNGKVKRLNTLVSFALASLLIYCLSWSAEYTYKQFRFIWSEKIWEMKMSINNKSDDLLRT